MACSSGSPPPAPPAPAALPAPALVPVAPRRPLAPALPDDAQSVSLRALQEELDAPGGRIENPCQVRQGQECLRRGLDSFFEALDASAAASNPVVIAALGNSLIAGDGVVDVLRARLQAAFGDGGRGFLLADRMASYGGRSRCATKAWGWSASTFAPPYKLRWPFGVSGVHHTAQSAGATSVFNVQGETVADVWWLDRPEAAAVEVLIDGQRALTLEPTHQLGGRRTRVQLGPSSKELKLVAAAKGAVLHGLVLQKERPGLVLDMLGVPSADASIFLQADADIFDDQLRSRSPSLVMLMFGGNETKRIAWGRSSEEKVMRDLRTLIGRVRKASDAACWVVGPLDAVVQRPGTGPYTQRPQLEEVIAMERAVALEEGCAWFDLFRAMGGTGSIQRFDKKGLMHGDRVHPKGRGLDLLGQLLSDALFDAYRVARSGDETETPGP